MAICSESLLESHSVGDVVCITPAGSFSVQLTVILYKYIILKCRLIFPYNTKPFFTVTAAAVFSSGACIIGDLRGKDGPLNHILAGVLSGVSIAAYSEYSATVDYLTSVLFTRVANFHDLRFYSR